MLFRLIKAQLTTIFLISQVLKESNTFISQCTQLRLRANTLRFDAKMLTTKSIYKLKIDKKTFLFYLQYIIED